MRLLVGDIGGTTTRLALATLSDGGAVALSDEHRYPSASAPDLDTHVRAWLARRDCISNRRHQPLDFEAARQG